MINVNAKAKEYKIVVYYNSMYIKEVKIRNYKCLEELDVNFRIPDGETYGSGLNIFVGENNTGKSSLMEAMYFVRNKAKKEVKRIGAGEEESYVEQSFGNQGVRHPKMRKGVVWYCSDFALSNITK